jgi:hypothetical protein
MKQFFVKIWSWDVDDYRLHSKYFHYDNIIVYNGKYNNLKNKEWINFWKK